MKHRTIIMLVALVLLALLSAACAPAASVPVPTQSPAKATDAPATNVPTAQATAASTPTANTPDAAEPVATPDIEKVIKPQPEDWKLRPRWSRSHDHRVERLPVSVLRGRRPAVDTPGQGLSERRTDRLPAFPTALASVVHARCRSHGSRWRAGQVLGNERADLC